MHTDRHDTSQQLEEPLIQILQEARRHPISFKRIHKELARKVDACRAQRVLSALTGLVKSGAVMSYGQGESAEFYWTANMDRLKARLCAVLRAHHARYPYEPGMSAGEIRRNFSEGQTINANRNIDTRLFELTVSTCKHDGVVAEGNCGL